MPKRRGRNTLEVMVIESGCIDIVVKTALLTGGAVVKAERI